MIEKQDKLTESVSQLVEIIDANQDASDDDLDGDSVDERPLDPSPLLDAGGRSFY